MMLSEFTAYQLDTARSHLMGSDHRGFALSNLSIAAQWVLDGDHPEDARRFLRSAFTVAMVVLAENPRTTPASRRRLLRSHWSMVDYLARQYGGRWSARADALAAELAGADGRSGWQGEVKAALVDLDRVAAEVSS